MQCQARASGPKMECQLWMAQPTANPNHTLHRKPPIFGQCSSHDCLQTPQVTVALSGEPTAYSHDPKKAMAEPPLLPAGGSAALVALVQARNNARVLVAGSLDMFSDELFDASVEVAETGKR